MEVKIYATLRPIVGGAIVPNVIEPGENVRALVDGMIARWPGLRPEMLDEEGNLLSRIHVFVNGRSIQYLDSMETVIGEDDRIAIFPPVGGG